MFLGNNQTTWGYKTMPPSYEACAPKPMRVRNKRSYPVQASSHTLFAGAREAKRARWSNRRYRSPKASLPPENIAAIKLLDSWLAMPEIDSGERAEDIRRRIDENRLSDRKFFT